MILSYPREMLVVMPHGSTERTKDTTEAFTPWLEKVLLKVINMKKNYDVKQKHQQKSIYAISIVN